METVGSVPRGVFQGRNFMTPGVAGYYKGTHAGVTVYVELSTGRGIENEPIFGVTVRRANGDRLSPDPSKLFHSQRAAQQYITGGLGAPESDADGEDSP